MPLTGTTSILDAGFDARFALIASDYPFAIAGDVLRRPT